MKHIEWEHTNRVRSSWWHRLIVVHIEWEHTNTVDNGAHRTRFAETWVQFFKFIDVKKLKIDVYWMPNHIDIYINIVPSCMQAWHVKSKQKGRWISGRCICIALHSYPILDLLKNLTLLQNRIIAIMKILPQRAHNIKMFNAKSSGIVSEIS